MYNLSNHYFEELISLAIQFLKLLKELQLYTASWYRPFSKPYNSTSDCWPQMQPIWIKPKKKNEKKTILLCAYAYSFDFTIFNVRKNLVRFLDATWRIGSSAIEDSKIKYDLILVLSYSHDIFIHHNLFLWSSNIYYKNLIFFQQLSTPANLEVRTSFCITFIKISMHLYPLNV